MKKNILLTLGLCLAAVTIAAAQDKKENENYKFTDIRRLPATAVKQQGRTGTCWAWATLSMLESEIIRKGKDSVSLSPMFVVWNNYHGKGEKYIRMNATMNFSPGGVITDPVWAIRNYGIVPYGVYVGINYDGGEHFHGELTPILKGYADGVMKTTNTTLSNVWQKGYDAVLDVYLGKLPQKFTWKGGEYTPRTFATDACGLDMDDYVSLTSFTHHPFYAPFPIEGEDNWLWTSSYNIPLDELIDVMDKATDKGYTFAWSSDISEYGFDRPVGIAVVPDENVRVNPAEKEKWLATPKATRIGKLAKSPGKEVVTTQDIRQADFNSKETTGDHAMHIIGKAVDQLGTKYFIVKNSWGIYGNYDGFLYASYPYATAKTISILINKDALPKELRKKLGI